MAAAPDDDDDPRPGFWRRTRWLVGELGPAAPLLVVACVGPVVGLLVVASTHATWLAWFGDGAGSVVGFCAVAAVVTAMCMLPTHATSLVAGYLFGEVVGIAAGWLVVLLAAALAFFVWTRCVGSRVVQVVARSPKARRVHTALLGQSFWRTAYLITLLRLSPVMPFAATNLLMAAFGVRVWAFLVGTMLGITPRALAVAWIGAELAELDWTAGSNRWTTMLAIVATALVVFAIGRFARAALRRAALDDEVEVSA